MVIVLWEGGGGEESGGCYIYYSEVVMEGCDTEF